MMEQTALEADAPLYQPNKQYSGGGGVMFMKHVKGQKL
jgi:hypothetical protein